MWIIEIAEEFSCLIYLCYVLINNCYKINAFLSFFHVISALTSFPPYEIKSFGHFLNKSLISIAVDTSDAKNQYVSSLYPTRIFISSNLLQFLVNKLLFYDTYFWNENPKSMIDINKWIWCIKMFLGCYIY